MRRRSYDGRVYSCKMHDMVRDLTIRIVRKRNSAALMIEAGRYPQWILGIWALKRNSGLAKVLSLRVLDLSHVKLENICEYDFWGWISSLKRLACLNLLPNSIGKLLNLQILILKLPASITTLHKLTVLDLGNCPALKYLPQGISSLPNLQELYGFKPARRECSREAQQAHPPPHLEELYFGHYHGEATPHWINPNSLPELQYLRLEYARLVDMSPLFWSSDGGNSCKVEGLCLKFLPRLQVEWRRVQGVMPSLRYLEVSDCYMLLLFESRSPHCISYLQSHWAHF
ncbi:hypothetical protein HYC85_014376 [Camellia sinensis]|uniref:Uncharacterized protein n=1 Tax=Camellia sinensis TaxID=4442 RepID=A0A7J7H6B2_CAMSI|nr:hypothetical protein HYC85_014376 [Camellia sinensis]